MANDIYDFVIIGSGIAGALAAYKLSERKDGKRILIIEAGETLVFDDETENKKIRSEFVDTFALAEHRTPLSPYHKLESNEFVPSPDGTNKDDLNKYYQIKQADGDSQFFKATYQRINGGSTWSWRGNCPRFVPNDFLLKSKYLTNTTISSNAEDWAITYSDLEKQYCEAESEIVVMRASVGGGKRFGSRPAWCPDLPACSGTAARCKMGASSQSEAGRADRD